MPTSTDRLKGKVIMNEVNPNQLTPAQKFWNAFQTCVEENRVQNDRSIYYVRWAQAFARFLPGKRLRDRSREDMEAFLSDLNKRPGVMEWQVKQAEHALKILYEVFLPGYAPEDTTKPMIKTEEKNRGMIVPRAGLFRDREGRGSRSCFLHPGCSI